MRLSTCWCAVSERENCAWNRDKDQNKPSKDRRLNIIFSAAWGQLFIPKKTREVVSSTTARCLTWKHKRIEAPMCPIDKNMIVCKSLNSAQSQIPNWNIAPVQRVPALEEIPAGTGNSGIPHRRTPKWKSLKVIRTYTDNLSRVSSKTIFNRLK